MRRLYEALLEPPQEEEEERLGSGGSAREVCCELELPVVISAALDDEHEDDDDDDEEKSRAETNSVFVHKSPRSPDFLGETKSLFKSADIGGDEERRRARFSGDDKFAAASGATIGAIVGESGRFDSDASESAGIATVAIDAEETIIEAEAEFVGEQREFAAADREGADMALMDDPIGDE